MKGYFFQNDAEVKKTIGSFRKGENETALRFRPDAEGIWNYEIYEQEKKTATGSFLCIGAEESNEVIGIVIYETMYQSVSESCIILLCLLYAIRKT